MYLVTVDHPVVIIDSAPHTLSLVHATNLTHGHSASGLEPTRLGMHFNNSRPIIARSLGSSPHTSSALFFSFLRNYVTTVMLSQPGRGMRSPYGFVERRIVP